MQRKHLGLFLFIALFAGLGSYLLINSFAATTMLSSIDQVVPYDKASPWNQPIPTNATKTVDSDKYVNFLAGIGKKLTSNPDDCTVNVYVVDSSTPKYDVKIIDYNFNSYDVPNVLDDKGGVSASDKTAHNVPIPSGATADDCDGQITLWNPSTGDEWGFWLFNKTTSGAYEASNGFHTKTLAGFNGRFGDGKAGRGAGTTYFAGLVRKWEIEQGRIDHALAFAYTSPCCGDKSSASTPKSLSYPAGKSDGAENSINSGPEGTRYQLDPSISDSTIRGWGCTNACFTIAKALQKYGMYAIDNSGSSKIYLEEETTAQWSVNPTNNADVQQVATQRANLPSTIPWSAFRVVDVPCNNTRSSSCPTTGSSTASGPTANLWVSTTGSSTVNGTGNCQRSANPAEYDSSKDCTMAAAYQAALPGDNVLVKGGTYTNEVVFADKVGAAAPNIIYDEAPGESVTFNGGFSVGGYDNNIGVDYVTFKNFTFTNAANPNNANDGVVGIENSTKVIFDGVLVEGSPNCANNTWVSGGFKMYGDNSGIEIRNSEIRCVRNGKLISSEVTGGSTSANVNTVIYNTKIHTMWRDTVNDHNECFFATAQPGLTMDRVSMYDCTVMDVNAGCFLSSCVSWAYNYNWTIRNSIFEAPNDLGPGDPSGNGWLDGCNGTNPYGGHVWEYNLFGADWSTNSCGKSGMVIRGNIGRMASFGGCPSGPTYTANIFVGMSCSGVTQNDSILNSTNFTNSAGHVWSPASGSSPQVNSGSVSSFPTTDYLGLPRPSGSSPDAGPYEYQGTTPSPKPGDTNNDGLVNIVDLSTLLSHYNTNYVAADFNKDNIVNITDLSILLSNYGK